MGGVNGLTNQPQLMFMPNCWERPSPFSAADTDHQIPQVTDVRNLGVSPQHDLHHVSQLQRGCEYSKAFAVHDPKILLCTTKNSILPALMCHSAATP